MAARIILINTLIFFLPSSSSSSSSPFIPSSPKIPESSKLYFLENHRFDSPNWIDVPSSPFFHLKGDKLDNNSRAGVYITQIDIRYNCWPLNTWPPVARMHAFVQPRGKVKVAGNCIRRARALSPLPFRIGRRCVCRLAAGGPARSCRELSKVSRHE